VIFGSITREKDEKPASQTEFGEANETERRFLKKRNTNLKSEKKKKQLDQ